MARSTKKPAAKPADRTPTAAATSGTDPRTAPDDGAKARYDAKAADGGATDDATAGDATPEDTTSQDTTSEGTAPDEARRDEASPEIGEPDAPRRDETPDDVTPSEEAVVLSGEASGDTAGEDGAARDAGMDDGVPAEADPHTQVVTTSPPGTGSRGPGFLPLVLGGLVAGAIGYAVALFVAPQDVAAPDTARIDALEAEIAALSSAEAPAAPDLGPIESTQQDLSARIETLEGRIADLEARPAGTGDAAAAGPDDAALRDDVAALARQVEALGPEVAALRDDLGGRVAALETGLQDAIDRSASVEADATAMAREAARNQVRQALQSGAPYAEPLAVLGDAPDALAAPAGRGVATVADLSADFPPLAREALRVARASSDEAGLGSLFRSALNVRSLEPREGAGPDAVLSRAEAALRAGDVGTALAEIEALPDGARAVLSDWTARAEARVAAVAAADDFLKDG